MLNLLTSKVEPRALRRFPWAAMAVYDSSKYTYRQDDMTLADSYQLISS